MDERLQYLLDRQEIADQVNRYAHIIDNKEFDRLLDVFTPDAFVDYRGSGGEAGDLAHAEEFLGRTMATVSSQHLLGNVECWFGEDKNTAKTRAILFNPMTYDVKGREYTFFCGLFYNCDWRRTEQGWRMTKLTQEYSYMYRRPLPPEKEKK